MDDNNNQSTQSSSLTSLVTRANEATSSARNWNLVYMRIGAVAAILALIAIGAQFVSSKKSEDAIEAKDDVIAEKDRLAEADSKSKDVLIRSADAKAEEAKAKGEEANKEAAKANARALELENANLLLSAEIAKANATAATAQKEAAQAKLELEKFRTPRALTLDKTKQERIVGKLKSFSGLQFDVGNTVGDAECDMLLAVLEDIFKNAGLKEVDWVYKPGSGAMMYVRAGRPAAGSVSATNVILEVDAKKHPELWQAARDIAEAIKAEGIPAGAFEDIKSSAGNADVIHLLIGKKM